MKLTGLKNTALFTRRHAEYHLYVNTATGTVWAEEVICACGTVCTRRYNARLETSNAAENVEAATTEFIGGYSKPMKMKEIRAEIETFFVKCAEDKGVTEA